MGKIFPVCSWYNEKDLAHIFWVFKTMPNIYNGAFLVKTVKLWSANPTK